MGHSLAVDRVAVASSSDSEVRGGGGGFFNDSNDVVCGRRADEGEWLEGDHTTKIFTSEGKGGGRGSGINDAIEPECLGECGDVAVGFSDVSALHESFKISYHCLVWMVCEGFCSALSTAVVGSSSSW